MLLRPLDHRTGVPTNRVLNRIIMHMVQVHHKTADQTSVLFLTAILCLRETLSMNVTKLVSRDHRTDLQFLFWILLFGLKNSSLYTHWASNLKPQHIIWSPDSLWLGRYSSSAGQGAHTLGPVLSWIQVCIQQWGGGSVFYSVLSEAASGKAVTSQTHFIWERQKWGPLRILRRWGVGARNRAYLANQLYFPTSSTVTSLSVSYAVFLFLWLDCEFGQCWSEGHYLFCMKRWSRHLVHSVSWCDSDYYLPQQN